MEIGKSFSQGKLSWTVRYRSDEPAGDNNITGEIEIEISEPEEVEFPVKTGVRNADPYISFESENPVIELDSNIEKSLKFDVDERDSTENQESGSEQEDDDEQTCEVWFSDEGEEGGNYSCTFIPKEVVSLCLQILSEDADDGEVMEQIDSEYDTRIPAYTDLRRESRYCTEFADHVKVLSFLYTYTNPGGVDKNIEKEMFRFVEKRVINDVGHHQAYSSKSVSDLKQKIEICESKPNLPEIPDKDELIGLQQVNLAGELVDDGEFGEARERISKAVDRFNKSDSEELLPTKLKRDAIRGLRDESRCEFEEAAAHYSNAVEKAEETENIRAYEAWSEVAKIKEQLSEGNFEKARDLAGGIDDGLDSIYLIDLQKLTKLFEVYSDYAQGERSDAAAVFADINKKKSELPSSDAIVQFNTDYSTAFTMLITKQRRQQLGVDSEIGDDFRIMIRDAITPTGIEGNADSEEQAEQSGTQQHQNVGDVGGQSEADSERGYTETKRAQRDSQFREEVKEAYNQTCAICGADRMTPDGRPEVEAAHIRPVSEGGKDTITNGVALCRLHHWAFDNDWISIKDDYSIVVKDAPEVSGYEDFTQYQGSRLNLPESDKSQPDKNALEFHRRHHGFENGG